MGLSVWMSVRGRVVDGCGHVAVCLGAVACAGSAVGMFSRPFLCVCVCVEGATSGWRLCVLIHS